MPRTTHRQAADLPYHPPQELNKKKGERRERQRKESKKKANGMVEIDPPALYNEANCNNIDHTENAKEANLPSEIGLHLIQVFTIVFCTNLLSFSNRDIH
jgi:hypothetical protein